MTTNINKQQEIVKAQNVLNALLAEANKTRFNADELQSTFVNALEEKMYKNEKSEIVPQLDSSKQQVYRIDNDTMADFLRSVIPAGYSITAPSRGNINIAKIEDF